MTNQKIRILILDDNDFQRKTYEKWVRHYFQDCEIDTTSNKSKAIKLIREKTYHTALLDIMLSDTPGNTEGLDVLEFIRQQKEGTLAVMLSAIEQVDAPVRALRARIAVDFIMKKEIDINFDENEPPLYIKALQRAVEEVVVPLFGSLGRLTSYLAAPKDPGVWEYDVLKTLGAGGMDSLSRFLSDLIKPFFPLLPLKGVGPMTVDGEKKACYGAYWSKALGKPIWVCVVGKGGELFLNENVEEAIKSPKNKLGLRGGVWQYNADRDDFVDRIWDVGKTST
jgi:CheY-like chemotaxis protein